MAQALEPIDVEDALRQELTSDSCVVFAPPVPENLGDALPCALVERDGGTRVNPFVDSHYVTVSVWASSMAQAMSEADRLVGALARLPIEGGTTDIQWRQTSITALPFTTVDSLNPKLSRVQFTASVTCRTTI